MFSLLATMQGIQGIDRGHRVHQTEEATLLNLVPQLNFLRIRTFTEWPEQGLR